MKKNIFTLLVFVSLTLSGCRDWLDINENPNYVSKADKTTLLPTVALMTADKVGYELTLTGYFWAQYTVQNRNPSQYTTVMNYDLNTQSAYFTSPWSYLYVRVLPSVRTILEQCEGESGVSNFVLEAKTMLAYNLYLLTSLSPIPVATLSNRELGGTGQNYIKSLFAVGFQGLLILVCVAIYAVLIQGIATGGDPIGAIWGTVGYTVLLCFMLFKTGSIAQRIFGAH